MPSTVSVYKQNNIQYRFKTDKQFVFRIPFEYLPNANIRLADTLLKEIQILEYVLMK